GQPCVSQRREVLWFLVAVHLDQVTVGHGYVLGEPSRRTETDPPAAAGAKLLIALMAFSAAPVAPVGVDDDQVSLGKTGSLRDIGTYAVDVARDLVAWYAGESQRDAGLEVSVHKLPVASAHSRRCHLEQDLSGAGFCNRHLFKHQRLLVVVHSRCTHLLHSGLLLFLMSLPATSAAVRPTGSGPVIVTAASARPR